MVTVMDFIANANDYTVIAAYILVAINSKTFRIWLWYGDEFLFLHYAFNSAVQQTLMLALYFLSPICSTITFSPPIICANYKMIIIHLPIPPRGRSKTKSNDVDNILKGVLNVV